MIRAFLLFLVLALPASAQVTEQTPQELKEVGVVEHLGAKIPMDLAFTDEKGAPVKLGDFFGQGKPVILNLAYYECPMLCTLVLNGVAEAVKKQTLKPERDFTLLTVTVDPKEHHDLALLKRGVYVKALGGDLPEGAWHFLTNPTDQARKLALAIGFQYHWDEEGKQWAHPAVTIILTADGTISRYLYGISYKPRDLRLALVEASEGKIGSTVDKVLLYCFHYDPEARGYVLFARNIMKIGGAFTMLLLGFFLFFLWKRERPHE